MSVMISTRRGAQLARKRRNRAGLRSCVSAMDTNYFTPDEAASISGANGIHFGPDGMFYRDISLKKHIKARVEQVTG